MPAEIMKKMEKMDKKYPKEIFDIEDEDEMNKK